MFPPIPVPVPIVPMSPLSIVAYAYLGCMLGQVTWYLVARYFGIQKPKQ